MAEGQEGSRIPRVLPFVFLVRSMWASLDLAWVLEYAVHPYPHEVGVRRGGYPLVL